MRFQTKTKLIVFAFFSLLQIATFARDPAPNRISFQNLLENKDISLGAVTAFLQDSDGFLWFGGAAALIRYDGYEFRQFDYHFIKEGKPAHAPLKFVQFLFEDSKKNIWVSTRSGMYRYSPKTEQLQRIEDSPQQTFKLSTSDLWQAKELPSGEIVVAGTTGLVIIDPKSGDYSKLTPSSPEAKGMTGQRVNAIYLNDRDKDTVWLGTEAGLEKLTWSSLSFELFKPYMQDESLVSANYVRDIVEDDSGKFWLGTANGLIHFDPVSKTSKRYINEPDNRFSLGGNDIWKLLIDSKGFLWIASDGGGASVFDQTQNKFINHQFEAGRPGSLNSNQVRTVYEDRSGDIWVGNYPTGINFYDRSSSAISSYANVPSNPNSLSHSSVLSIKEDTEGNLWLGTDGGGLNYFNRNKDEFISYQHEPGNEKSIGSNAVLTVHIDRQGLIWTGTWGGGAAYFDPSKKTFTRLPFDEQREITGSTSTSERLNSAHVWSIRQDKKNQNLFWMTTHTGGLSSYNKQTKSFKHYTHFPEDPNSLASNQSWTTFEDSRGELWIGTNAGLNLLNRNTDTFTIFTTDPNDPKSLSNPSVLSIYEDSQGRLWFGTDKGLNLFDRRNKSFTSYTKADGFNDDVIRHILEDDTGKLWLSTDNGVSSFDTNTKEIKNYNRESGRLMGGFHTESGVVSQSGEVIFGGTTGVRIFKPNELVKNTNLPPVVLTDFKVFADSIRVGGEDGLLKNAINHTQSITLDYKKSMFEIHFAALNFRDSGKNRYAFKLEGFDENWLQVGNQRQAKYTNLNAGTYTFRVKASNNDGVWNEEGTSLTIIQTPPPWLTWWAYALYALAFILAIIWFIHHQSRKRKLVEQQNRLLELKVSERTAELAQKNNDIQAMLCNMPQGLFTILPGGTIHSEYAAYLEEIFATDHIAGREMASLLFDGADIGSDVLASVEAAVFAIIGEDEMNYDFNKPLLINEYHIHINAQEKVLSLDWSPIIENGRVIKLMVSVRDVTQLRKMEMEAHDQKRQLEIMGQLINVSAKKYLGFEESAAAYIEANRQVIELSEKQSDSTVSLLFRNMHTIKGNCRTFGFSHISNVVHEVESAYAALKNEPGLEWNPDKLLQDLDLVEKAIGEYSKIYRKVLGREDDSAHERHDGFWMANAVMEKIQNLVEVRDMDNLLSLVYRVNATTLEYVLADVIASLQSIAIQLGKKSPVIHVKSEGILVKSSIFELLNDVFAHILRNSVDHGIETPEERVRNNKDERGLISIESAIVSSELHISVVDDGAGINLRKLFEKGVEKNYWPKDGKPSNLEIAQTIFRSGVSTKNAVTEISGRGVGMDAVKQFVENIGGRCFLELEGSPCSDDFAPFRLIIAFPMEHFLLDQGEKEALILGVVK